MDRLKEQWKDIFDGYSISNKGEIVSFKRDKFKLVQFKNKGKYKFVNLYLNGSPRSKSVGLLVANAFIPNPNNYKQIRFKDFNPDNCRVDNIEWASKKDCLYQEYEIRRREFYKNLENENRE